MKNIFLFFAIIMLASCGKDSLSVDEYIEENNLTTRLLDRGVHIIIHEPGNDSKPALTDSVRVGYEGMLTDGTVFDMNEDITFYLSRLILGWQIGLREIGEGGSCTLIIPSSAGYGSTAQGSIPANSTLIFDMNLIQVK